MKNLIFFLSFVSMSMSGFTQTQDIDTIRLKRLDTNIKMFINNLGMYIDGVDTLNDVKNINTLSNKINKSSIILIDSINSIFKITENDDEIDAAMYYGLSAAFSQNFPSLSAVYSSLGSNAIMNSKDPPKYYNKLKEIRDITYRLSKRKKMIKLKKLIAKLKKLYDELKLIG